MLCFAALCEGNPLNLRVFDNCGLLKFIVIVLIPMAINPPIQMCIPFDLILFDDQDKVILDRQWGSLSNSSAERLRRTVSLLTPTIQPRASFR